VLKLHHICHLEGENSSIIYIYIFINHIYIYIFAYSLFFFLKKKFTFAKLSGFSSGQEFNIRLTKRKEKLLNFDKMSVVGNFILYIYKINLKGNLLF